MDLQTQLGALFYTLTVIFPTGMVAWRVERRNPFWVRCIAWTGVMLAGACFMVFWVDLLVISFPAIHPNTLWLHILRFFAAFLLAVVGVKVCFECDWWGALFCANTGYCLQHIGARLYTVISDILFQGALSDADENLFAPIVTALVSLVFWLIALRGSPRRERLMVGRRWQIVIATCVVAVTIGYNTFGIMYADSQMRMALRTGTGLTYARGSLLFVYVMSMLVALLALLLEFNVRSNEGLSSERDALARILEDGKRQYQREKENIQLLDLKYHDLKHQLAALKGKIYQEQIDELAEAVNIYDTTVHTGNEALDVVLTQKALYCANHGITLTYLINGGHYDFIPRHEMYALFNNILDNAIQAVEFLPQEQRIISVTEQSRQGFLSVRAENYCAAAPVFQNGLPVTDKTEPGHGYGMKSIRLITEKYGGGLSVKAADGMFVLDLYFQRD